MAKQRCLPTNFFRDPDVIELSSGDIRLILIGLVLHADDEGRGLAHAKILGRELDYPPELIEAALHEIENCELVQCYQVERHRYYSLTRWRDWETLSKPTPSKYPAPPRTTSPENTQENPEYSENPQGNSGKSCELPPEGEEEKEREPKRTEGEEELPPNVVSFLPPRTDSTTTQQTKEETTLHVADILKLAVNPALRRIVEEYIDDPLLSLLGEADAACEYIDDMRRNHNNQRMSPSFFRRWLKREHEDAMLRRATGAQAIATICQSGEKGSPVGGFHNSEGSRPPSPHPQRDLMNLREQYTAEMQASAKQRATAAEKEG